MNQKERMLASLPYLAGDEQLKKERLFAQEFCFDYNQLPPSQKKVRKEKIKSFLGASGQSVHIESPFRCDYGYTIKVGENFYSNYNLTILDVAPVTIGENVMFGPNVSLYTAGHPLHPESRNSGYEYGIPITIDDNVWLGGNVVVNPGVTIGDNVIIGAGSVVTKDIPANSIAIGNPCRVLREVTEEDRDYYYKDRLFDVDDYK
ncbi:sugar O-acetyltransferase [Granulicatella seriolae]|uniref:Acetyltransferase n=1 Tax=Granulicatella seriolae TaxID=2967226 RepID=A0ABT1WML8_9LACT|nr:sugar O-acetyltransferase [Granulicatella seriolae]